MSWLPTKFINWEDFNKKLVFPLTAEYLNSDKTKWLNKKITNERELEIFRKKIFIRFLMGKNKNRAYYYLVGDKVCIVNASDFKRRKKEIEWSINNPPKKINDLGL